MQVNSVQLFLVTVLTRRESSHARCYTAFSLSVFLEWPTAGKSTLYNRLMDKKANRAYKLSSDKKRHHKGKKKKYSGVRTLSFVHSYIYPYRLTFSFHNSPGPLGVQGAKSQHAGRRHCVIHTRNYPRSSRMHRNYRWHNLPVDRHGWDRWPSIAQQGQ